MKFRLTFKTPGIIDQALTPHMDTHCNACEEHDPDCDDCNALEEKSLESISAIKQCMEKFVNHGETITIEFDTAAGHRYRHSCYEVRLMYIIKIGSEARGDKIVYVSFGGMTTPDRDKAMIYPAALRDYAERHAKTYVFAEVIPLDTKVKLEVEFDSISDMVRTLTQERTNRIFLVNLVRRAANLGLAEAKARVDEIEATL